MTSHRSRGGTAPIYRVVHPTDLSAASQIAFIHALRFALAARAELDVLHVSPDAGKPDWAAFPEIRRTLHRWGVLPEGAAPETLREIGLRIGKVVAVDRDPARAALEYVEGHRTELLVLATHQRRGVDRWLHRPTAEPIARRSGTMTLFLPRDRPGFVSPETGRVSLRRILVPIDHAPAPQAAADTVEALVSGLGCPGGVARALHVGAGPAIPAVRVFAPEACRWEQSARAGDPVDEIVATAVAWPADLIVTTTQGHAGVLDALRGSTTERILRRAPCPVLAVPAGSRAMRRLFPGASEPSPGTG